LSTAARLATALLQSRNERERLYGFVIGLSVGLIVASVFFLIIVILIPLALRGVRYTPSSASAMLRRNLWVYGLGGIVAPFVGIKAIDVVITTLGLA